MFNDRAEAGRKLAQALIGYRDERPLVFALPRGGVPVAVEVARALDAPLDVLLVRKVGAPFQPELAIGAVVDGANPIVVRHDDIVDLLGVSDERFQALVGAAEKEIERRRRIYRGASAPLDAKGRTCIVIDDGVATGATLKAAIAALRQDGAKRVIAAVPVAPAETVERLKALADDVVCLSIPEMFLSVGGHYRRFPQLTDDDVVTQLEAARGIPDAAKSAAAAPTT